MYQRVATNPDHALEYKNLIMLLHFLERRQSLKKQSHRLFSDKLERILSKFDSIQITLDKVDENQSPISKFARLLCRNYIKSFTIAPQETIIKLPPIEIIFAFDNNRVSDLNVPIEADLLEAIESCIEFLTSPNRPKSEIQASNEWLRKSVQKTEIANITSLGINKWIETFKREPDCCLVASMLKGLIRRIPNGLIPKGVQELLMFFMSSTVIVEKETVLDIQALFGIEQSRFGVLVQVGELARYIFKNAETSILPVSLSIVVPVDENLVKEVVEGSLLKAEKAKETISTSMEYFDRWNSAFGSVLANSDMFFENGFEFIEIAKSAQV